MSTFRRTKSELFEGGAKELRSVVERIRAISATPVEREFDPAWAVELKRRVLDGRSLTFIWAVADMPSAGGFVRLRVNGQHSSWALAELLKADQMPDGLAIHLDTYAVADEDGAVQLFRQFDARKSARSKEDVSGAYQCFQPELRECVRAILKTAAEGVTFFRREWMGRAVSSGDDVYSIFTEKRLHPFFLMVNDLLKDGKSNELKRVPVMAVIYGTALDDEKTAAEFWRLVALGTKRNEEDAATDLSNELTRIRKDREKVNAFDLAARCVKAWDAYNNGVRVSNFKVNIKKGLPPLGTFSDEAA